MESIKEKLLVIDTFYFIHRSFHGFPKDLKNNKGDYTNILFGFTKALLDMVKEFRPTHVICSWESEDQPSFRKGLYNQYQINRAQMEPIEEVIFRSQFANLIKIINAFNIPRLTLNGFEGDDVIGTVTHNITEDMTAIVATSDLDLTQLITDKVSIFKPSKPPFVKKEVLDISGFRERYGFEPHQIIDFKALRGDASDNIPGVKGIGEVTAKKLILQFGTVENIYENLEKVESESVRNKLKEGKEMCFLSKQLATIITDAPLFFDMENARFNNIDLKMLEGLFLEFDFKSLFNSLKTLELLNKKEEKQTQINFF